MDKRNLLQHFLIHFCSKAAFCRLMVRLFVPNPNVAFKMLHSKCCIQNVAFKMLHLKCCIQNVAFKMLHSKCCI